MFLPFEGKIDLQELCLLTFIMSTRSYLCSPLVLLAPRKKPWLQVPNYVNTAQCPQAEECGPSPSPWLSRADLHLSSSKCLRLVIPTQGLHVKLPDAKWRSNPSWARGYSPHLDNASRWLPPAETRFLPNRLLEPAEILREREIKATNQRTHTSESP